MKRDLTSRFQTELAHLKPIISVLMIVATMMLIVLLQMEERRMGYGILKFTRQYKERQEEKRVKEIALAKSMRLDKIEKLASRRSSLRRTDMSQVVYLNEDFDFRGQP